MAVSHDQWRALLQNLRPREPASSEQYVRPARSCVDEVVSMLTADPSGREKVLLVGPRGGGKSSELRAVARALEARGGSSLATADLDTSQVNAASVTALDLLYVSALAVLQAALHQGMTAEAARALLQPLNAAYAGSGAAELGDNLGRLSSFAQVGAALAVVGGAAAKMKGVDIDPAAAMAGGALGALGAGIGVGGSGKGVVLREHRLPVVGEATTVGRAVLDACRQIVQARRDAGAGPLYVLIDGLEKMNGEANERFRQVFEQTRLIADAPWATVIAAPPCTLTETNAVMALGYLPVTVWGFGPDDGDGLLRVVKHRFRSVGLDPDEAAEPGALELLVSFSGSLPRHAMDILWRAVLDALGRGAERLTRDSVEHGLQTYGQALGSGLTSDDLEILGQVKRTGRLPGAPRAAMLFADNRILSYPPEPGTRLPRWAVHPLLAGDVDAFAAESAT